MNTNVLLTSIGHHTPFRPIFDAILRQRLTLVVSTSILLEYENLLSISGQQVTINVRNADYYSLTTF